MKIMYYKLDQEPNYTCYLRVIDYSSCFVVGVNDDTGEIKLHQGEINFTPIGTWGACGEKRIFGWKKTDMLSINIIADEQIDCLMLFQANLAVKITEREFLTALGVVCQK